MTGALRIHASFPRSEPITYHGDEKGVMDDDPVRVR